MMGPIINASSRNIGANGNLPNMSNTLLGWMQGITLGFVETQLVDGFVKETVRDVPTQGVVQPLKPQLLATKPEGQRHWEWQMMHCQIGLPLKPSEVIFYKSTRYRIMAKNNYEEYGYLEYHLVDDFVQNVWTRPSYLQK